jgi:hypothetical protein
MAGRRCPAKGCPKILTQGERYCPTHAREYEGRRGTPVHRGYDQAHRARRAAWQARIDAGQRVTCATCPAVLTGRAWDLGHDHERDGYIGPQCITCNRGEAGRRGRATQV